MHNKSMERVGADLRCVRSTSLHPRKRPPGRFIIASARHRVEIGIGRVGSTLISSFRNPNLGPRFSLPASTIQRSAQPATHSPPGQVLRAGLNYKAYNLPV
jgi:hypothetical protein